MKRNIEEKENLLKHSTQNGSSTNLSYGSIKQDKIEVETEKGRFLCTKRDTIIVSVAFALALIVITTTLVIGLPKIREKQIQYYDTSFPVSSSPLKSYGKAVVVSDGKICSTVGRRILEKNGSAVDAAIASLFCNGVVTPESMGLGGGFFMVIYSKESGKSEVIDARETAPSSATVDMFHGNGTLSQKGGLAIAVPGELKGYWLAHQKYGNLPWSELVQPSVNICMSGFEVSKHMAVKLKALEKEILSNPSLSEEFINNATNELYKEGEIIKRPVLARTLGVVADKGADALYTGVLSKRFLQDIEDCGGIITERDLEAYQPKLKEALVVPLHDSSGKMLHTIPPPGSGVILSLILNILQGYNISSEDMNDLDQAVLTYHRMTEAFKYSFAQRELLADEDFANITDFVTKLASKEYADSIRQKISDKATFEAKHYDGVTGSSGDHGTSQVSVLAPNGDAVSATSTINTYFGSRCRSTSTGIILNNNMDDFSSPNITNYFGLPPFPKNFIEPGKRPLSSMAPSILTDDIGDVQMVLGGMGGTHIITATSQVLMRLLWLNANCKEAVDALRLHHQLVPNYLQYESGFPKVYLDKLKVYGHEVKLQTESSDVLIIERKEDKIEANVDFRKGGSSDGF